MSNETETSSRKRETKNVADQNFTFQAMYRQFEKLNSRFDEREERFEILREETQSADRVTSGSGRGTTNATTRNTYQYEEYDEFEEDEEEEWVRNRNQGRGGQNGRGRFKGDRVRNERGREDDVERVDRKIRSIKMKMPSFQGK